MASDSKLGLGGHSFIQELGNDPQATFEEQCAIVEACLDNGIRLIDTTYYQERVALGHVLNKLGRRKEAEIMAWNFFKQSGKEDKLVGYSPLEPDHIETMLEELQVSYLDILVIHAHSDRDNLLREIEIAEHWMSKGKIKRIGLGMAQLQHLDQLQEVHPITHVLAPYNAFHREAETMFARAKDMGMTTVALSPFVRGWKLDEIGEDKGTAADLLLRWVAAQQKIDQVIVSMRKSEWVRANLQAAARGGLTEEERLRLESWVSRIC